MHPTQKKHPRHKSKRRRIFIGRLLKYGVDEGNRTLDHRNHNPALYQLSYVHHIAMTCSFHLPWQKAVKT